MKISNKKIIKNAISVLKTIIDPELQVDVWSLAIIYSINIDINKNLLIVMTLTSPTCPYADYLLDTIQENLENQLPNINQVIIDLVWEPKWSPSMLSEELQLQLGY